MPSTLSPEQAAIREAFVNAVAKGVNQRDAANALWNGYTIHSFDYGLQGSAQQSRGSYRASWLNFVKRIEALGYKLEQHPGPRGGIGSATYTLIKPEVPV